MLIPLDSFGGEIPRLGREQLPQNAAEIASNCLLLSGELRGLHQPSVAQDLTSEGIDIATTFRIPMADPDPDIWVSFEEKNTHFLKGPLINDAYNRYYWTSEGSVPQYNTRDRIENGDPPYILGVPQPVASPTIVVTGGSADTVTRTYGYSFVSEYGEEGPLCELVVESGPSDGSWDLSGMDTTVPDAANRPAFTKRIYRTITSLLGTALYFVAEIPLAQATYSDTSLDSEVALNSQNESLTWFPPPDDLEGLIAHPNGFLVGFTGRDVYFSEPYRPHAWPPGYVVSSKYNIVALGTFGNSIAILTEGAPAMATGINPASIVLSDTDAAEPCVSKFGVVEMPDGVYYPGVNGLMVLNHGGLNNATKMLCTKDEWQLRYFPHLIDAVRWQDVYIAMFTASDGFMFAPQEPIAAFSTLDDYWSTDKLLLDDNSGEVYGLFENIVYNWNPPQGIPLTYTWKSREFRSPKPVNLAAYRIYWDKNLLSSEAESDILAYNTARLAAGSLNVFNQDAINGIDRFDLAIPFGHNETRMPLGGTPLVDTSLGDSENALLLKLWADGEVVHEYNVDDTLPGRLPAGYKADRWAFEFVGRVNIRSARFATTGKELMSG